MSVVIKLALEKLNAIDFDGVQILTNTFGRLPPDQ